MLRKGYLPYIFLFVAVSGLFLLITSAKADVVTYSITVQKQLLGMTIAGGPTVNSSVIESTTSPFSVISSITITNTSSSTGYVHASLGTVPTGLGYVSALPATAGQVEVTAEDGSTNAVLTSGDAEVGSIAAGNDATVDTTFLFGANTSSGSYSFPITWTMEGA